MKVSAMNDIVANACLKLSATVKIITFSTETHDTTVKRTKVSASLRGKKKVSTLTWLLSVSFL
jgi:hypothetical protein